MYFYIYGHSSDGILINLTLIFALFFIDELAITEMTATCFDTTSLLFDIHVVLKDHNGTEILVAFR